MPQRKYGPQTDVYAVQADLNHRRVRRIEPQKLRAKDTGEHAEDHAEGKRPEQADIHRGEHAARLARADVLPGKAGDGLLECVHRLIDELADVAPAALPAMTIEPKLFTEDWMTTLERENMQL